MSAQMEWHRSASHALSSANDPKRLVPASIQMRLRLSCTFFSTTPFSHPDATLQKSGSNRQWLHMAEKRALTMRPLPFLTLSTAVFMLS